MDGFCYIPVFRLTDQGGCCIYYNEPQLLSEIEEHLGVTIQQVGLDIKVEADEFDGKVVYGQKRKDNAGPIYEGHATQLAPTLASLAQLEKEAQHMFLKTFCSSKA